MPRLLAPSISSTSKERPSAISWQRGSSSGKVNFRPACAIQAFGKDSGQGCLARSTRADEKGKRERSVLFDRMGEGLRDVFLADDLGKALGADISGL